jgi:hypothetical protein
VRHSGWLLRKPPRCGLIALLVATLCILLRSQICHCRSNGSIINFTVRITHAEESEDQKHFGEGNTKKLLLFQERYCLSPKRFIFCLIRVGVFWYKLKQGNVAQIFRQKKMVHVSDNYYLAPLKSAATPPPPPLLSPKPDKRRCFGVSRTIQALKSLDRVILQNRDFVPKNSRVGTFSEPDKGDENFQIIPDK